MKLQYGDPFYIRVGDSGVALQAGGASSTTWESFETLQTLIDATPSDGTLDLNGRRFAPLEQQTSELDRVVINDPITLTNGTIGLIEVPTWSPVGGGVYEHTLEYDTYAHARFYIVDENATDRPQLATYPVPVNDTAVGEGNYYDLDEFRLNYTPQTMPWQVSDTDITVDGSGYISQIDLSAATWLADFESVVNPSNASTFCLQMHVTDNRNGGSKVTGYDSGTKVLTVESTIVNTRSTVSFSISGPSLIGTRGDYAYDPGNNKVVYKPANGDPSAAVVPSGRYGIRCNYSSGPEYSAEGVAGSTVLKNIEFLGGVESSVNYLVDLGTSSALISGCSFHDFDTGVSMDSGATSKGTIDRCSFTWMTARGVSARPGLRITNSEFRFTQGSSTILYQTTSEYEDAELAESLVDSCVFETPCSTHGNALSFYNKSIANAVVRNNIFVNSYLGFINQNSGGASDIYPTKFIAENNCFIYNKVAGSVTLGEGAFKVAHNDFSNTGDYASWPSTPTWVVTIRNNTVVADESVYLTSNDKSLVRGFTNISLSNVDDYSATTISIEDNVFGQYLQAAGAAGYTTLADNAQFIPLDGETGYSTFLAVSDASSISISGPSDDGLMSNVWDFTANAPKDDVVDLTTAASDGGRVGIRFNSFPNRSQVFEIGPGWADTYSPQALP